MLVTGGPIYAEHGRAPIQAMLIREGQVAAIGTLSRLQRLLGPATPRLDLSGSVVLPAFIDPHQHAYLVARDPSTDSLLGYDQDIAGLLERLHLLIRSDRLPGLWRRFHGYRPLHLRQLRSPTAAELDSVCQDRPLHIISRTFHESAVNSAGLEALGIGPGTPDPAGGRIVRDRRGRATGILLEAASFDAEHASRGPATNSDWGQRLTRHGRVLASLGITRIGDAAVPVADAAAFVSILRGVGIAARPLLVGDRIDRPALVTGQTAKVLVDGGEYCHLCFTGRQVAAVSAGGMRAAFGSDRRLATAVGQRTGFPRRGADQMWHTGLTFPAGTDLASVLRQAAETDSSLAVHAVGNGAVGRLLTVLADGRGPGSEVPVRVEHAMVLDPGLVGELGGRGASVVVQPGFLSATGFELTRNPVPAPVRIFPLRSLLNAGAQVSLSSDYPAADLNPWSTIRDAVLRQDCAGTPIHPGEGLTVAEALRSHTITAAHALGADDAGELTAGKRADFIVVDQDPYAIDPVAFDRIRIEATYSGGRQIHPPVVD